MDPIQAEAALTLNKRILSALGIWPENPSDLRFSLYFTYLFIFTILEYADFLQFIRIPEKTVKNLTTSIPTTTLLLKITMLRKNMHSLKPVMNAMRKDFIYEQYKTPDEMNIVLRYNAIAKRFARNAVPLVFGTIALFYVKPLIMRLNSSMQYELPFQIRTFFNVTELRTYILIYAGQFPVLLTHPLGLVASESLMATLVLHICSQLSVLALRIEKIPSGAQCCSGEIRKIVERHSHLIRMAKIVKDSFGSIAMVQVLGMNFIVCIAGYQLLMSAGEGNVVELVSAVFYMISVLLMIFVYSFLGECLIRESKSVEDAYYACQWYAMPKECVKSLNICITRSQKPLELTGGKFYVLSLEMFADVLRAALAYLSVLRNLM